MKKEKIIKDLGPKCLHNYQPYKWIIKDEVRGGSSYLPVGTYIEYICLNCLEIKNLCQNK